jgi:hypothetical protein
MTNFETYPSCNIQDKIIFYHWLPCQQCYDPNVSGRRFHKTVIINVLLRKEL